MHREACYKREPFEAVASWPAAAPLGRSHRPYFGCLVLVCSKIWKADGVHQKTGHELQLEDASVDQCLLLGCPFRYPMDMGMLRRYHPWDLWSTPWLALTGWSHACSSDRAPTKEGTLLEESTLRLFSGPRDLAATAAKYMYSFREAEETDVSVKRARMVHSASYVSNLHTWAWNLQLENMLNTAEDHAVPHVWCW